MLQYNEYGKKCQLLSKINQLRLNSIKNNNETGCCFSHIPDLIGRGNQKDRVEVLLYLMFTR